MAQRKTAVKPRAKFTYGSKATRVREIFSTLSQEELADSKLLAAKLKKAKVIVAGSDLYRIRKEYWPMNGEAAPATATQAAAPATGVNLNQILLVKKVAEQVGGIATLKQIITTIERIRQ